MQLTYFSNIYIPPLPPKKKQRGFMDDLLFRAKDLTSRIYCIDVSCVPMCVSIYVCTYVCVYVSTYV